MLKKLPGPKWDRHVTGLGGAVVLQKTPHVLPAATSLVFYIYFSVDILFVLTLVNKFFSSFIMIYPFITVCLTYLDGKTFF